MKYFIGLDLGQANDYSALAVVEKIVPPDPLAGVDIHVIGGSLRPEARPRPRYDLVWLDRYPLHLPYPEMVGRVAALLASPPLRGRNLLAIDNTGVGRPIVDLFRQAGLRPVPITISGGSAVTAQDGGYVVPKRDLVGAVKVALQSARLKIARGLPLADVLTRELLSFEVRISAAGHDQYAAWRENEHDDLVLAAALALWSGEKMPSRTLVTF